MKNTLYGIGLDIGVASVGWAVVGLNGTGEPVGLHRLGVRIFDKAEQPKTGESLAAPRRMARGMRRRLRRKALRRADVYALLERSGLSTREELAQMFEAGGLEDIYALRTRALDEPVGKAEFSRILLHLAQRRGFKSNRRTVSDGEDGRLLAAVNENRRRMAQGGWRTVGEMLYRHEAFALHKRNKADDYLSTVGRDMVAEEASILFERIDIPKKLAEIEEEKKTAEAEQKPAVEFLPDIPFDDFCKVDMTVCKVLACENVKKSSKLLKFQLDDGSGTPRQILSGIAKYYKPEELVGKTVVAVTNLPPRKMMGQESNGMLLSAEKDEKLNLLMLDDKIPAGAKLC